MNDDAIIEMDVNGVSHRLLVREADELALKLKEAVNDVVSSSGGIFCSRCGRFLAVKKGRAGPQEAKCVCGQVEKFYDRPYIPSDPTVEFFVQPTSSGRFTFMIHSFDPDEWGSIVTLRPEEFIMLYVELTRFLESDNPASIKLDPFSIYERRFSLYDGNRPNPSSRRYVFFQRMRDRGLTHRECMDDDMFLMTLADLKGLLGILDSIVAQRNLYEQIESFMRVQSDVQDGHKDE